MRTRLLAHGDFLNLSRFSSDIVEPQTLQLENGVRVHIIAPGIVAFYPQTLHADSKYIVLSSGVHGNETAPVEICDDMVKRLFTGSLVPAHAVLFQFGNLDAMAIAKRFTVENMNRLFCGAHSAGEGLVNDERIRAKQLEDTMAAFFADAGDNAEKLHYDLHTAIRESKNEKFAVYPFLHGKPYSREQLSFMKACGVKTILLSESPTTTYSYHSSLNHGAHSFTVELGKVQPFGQNDMARFEDARDALISLVLEQQITLNDDLSDMVIYRVNQVINKQADDFVLHFADDTPNFMDFAKGDKLASETGAEYFAEQDGEAVVFPNANVAIGQRAILTVVPASLEYINV